jgi:hypothetical protein
MKPLCFFLFATLFVFTSSVSAQVVNETTHGNLTYKHMHIEGARTTTFLSWKWTASTRQEADDLVAAVNAAVWAGEGRLSSQKMGEMIESSGTTVSFSLTTDFAILEVASDTSAAAKSLEMILSAIFTNPLHRGWLLRELAGNQRSIRGGDKVPLGIFARLGTISIFGNVETPPIFEGFDDPHVDQAWGSIEVLRDLKIENVIMAGSGTSNQLNEIAQVVEHIWTGQVRLEVPKAADKKLSISQSIQIYDDTVVDPLLIVWADLPTLTSENIGVIDVANTALAGGLDARLMLSLRDELRATYDVRAVVVEVGPGRSVLAISTQVQQKFLTEAKTRIDSVLEELRETGLDMPREFGHFKRIILSRYNRLGTVDTGGAARNIFTMFEQPNRPNLRDKYLALQAMDPPKFRQVYRDALPPISQFNTIILGGVDLKVEGACVVASVAEIGLCVSR